MFLRLWTGLFIGVFHTGFTYEHCFGLVVSTSPACSPFINRGTRATGYDIVVVTQHGLVNVFIEDDDEKYLWSIISQP